jgi:lipoate-protein ligase A
LIILFSPSASPAFNLAAEEYLFSNRTDDILFLYVNEPCVVVGRNQDVLSEVDVDFCTIHKIPVFKRMSGGGTVYHDPGNLNYCFISTRVHGESPLKADFLQPIVKVLANIGIEVLIGNRNDLWLPGGHKISGTASHVGKNRLLHHGTLLYDTDLKKLVKSLSPKAVEKSSRGIASVPSPVKNIRSYLLENNLFAPSTESFFEVFVRQLVDMYCLESVTTLTPEEVSAFEPLSPVL